MWNNKEKLFGYSYWNLASWIWVMINFIVGNEVAERENNDITQTGFLF